MTEYEIRVPSAAELDASSRYRLERELEATSEACLLRGEVAALRAMLGAASRSTRDLCDYLWEHHKPSSGPLIAFLRAAGDVASWDVDFGVRKHREQEERTQTALDHVRMNASAQAQEARTQRAVLEEVARALGMKSWKDWDGSVVKRATELVQDLNGVHDALPETWQVAQPERRRVRSYIKQLEERESAPATEAQKQLAAAIRGARGAADDLLDTSTCEGCSLEYLNGEVEIFVSKDGVQICPWCVKELGDNAETEATEGGA